MSKINYKHFKPEIVEVEKELLKEVEKEPDEVLMKALIEAVENCHKFPVKEK